MSLNTYGYADEIYMESKTFNVSVSSKDKIIQVMDGNMLLASLSMELDNNILSLIGKNDMTVAEVELPQSKLINDIIYDDTNKQIIIYITMEDGTESEITIDVPDLVTIYEGCNGIEVDGNKIGIKINEDSSKYLSADDNGLSINISSLDDTFATEEEVIESLKDYATINMVKNELSSYATKDEISDMATQTWVNNQGFLTEHQDISGLITRDEFDNLKDSVDTKVSWVNIPTEETPNRKSIVLPNHDIILGTATDGNTYNLAMLSKWDVADYGSKSVHINLNGSQERPTYNDDKGIALLDDITNISIDIRTDLDSLKEKDIALEQAISDEASTRENVDNQLWDAINGEISTRENVDNQLWDAISGESTTRDDVDKQLWEAINGEISVRENADNQLLETINAEIERSVKEDEKIDISLETKVSWVNIPTEETPNRKSIVLPNHDILLGTATDGNTYNLAMLSKWDVADYGSKSVHINLNGSQERPTYNDDKGIALLDDITNSEGNLRNELDSLKEKDIALEQAISDEINDRITNDSEINKKIDDLHKLTSDEIVSINDLVDSIKLVKDSENDLVYNLMIGDVNKGVINIPKDQFLNQVSYNNETNILSFIITTSDDRENKIDIDLTDLVDEYNSGYGLSLDSKTFSVKIDSDSDDYLTVSDSGIKISGIKEEFNNYYKSSDIDSIFSTKDELNTEVLRAKSEELKLLGSEDDESSVMSLYGVKKYATINNGELTNINIKVDAIDSKLDSYITKDEAVILHDEIIKESKNYTDEKIDECKPQVITESVNLSKTYTDTKYTEISSNLVQQIDRITTLESRCDHFDQILSIIFDEHGDPIDLNFYTKEESDSKYAEKNELTNKVDWVTINEDGSLLTIDNTSSITEIETIKNQILALKTKISELEEQLNILTK